MRLHQPFVAALLLAAASPASAQSLPEPSFDLSAAIADGPPMTADRAAELAVRAAPGIERARALERASHAVVSRARAAMLPRLELTARYAHIDGFPDGQIDVGADPDALAAARMLAQQVTDPAARTLWLGTLDSQASGSVTLAIPRDQIAFGARLTFPVSDLFFAMMPALEAAEAGGRAHAAQIQATEAQVARSARDAFYQLARARGALAVAQQAVLQAEAQRARIDAAVRAGLLTEADGLAAAARVASAEQAVATMQAGVEMADAALRTLTGQPDGPIYGVAEPLAELEAGEPPAPLAALTAQALARRAELEAVRAVLTSQRAAARASDASGYPHVVLFAGADLASPNRYVIPPSDSFQPSWEVGALLTWAPNDALSAAHRGEELAAQHAATEAELAQLERAVRLEVRHAHASLRTSARAMEAARAALAAAEAAYASRDAALRAGEATVADVLASQAELDRARLAVVDAAVQRGLARAALEYSTGASTPARRR
ncbi:MAG: TolC family protein [Sandaracinaceae bacterium]|nr:TolC family protein [Sandaracinaceae bacterium]